HGGSGACTAASQQEGHGFDSRMGRCWLWGAGPSVLRWAISRAFLCGVRLFSQCPQEPQQHTLLSIPDQDGRFTSLGPRALKSCPGGSTIRDGLKAEQKFTATSGLRVCVCSVSWSPPYIYLTRVCCCELFVQ